MNQPTLLSLLTLLFVMLIVGLAVITAPGVGGA